MAIRRIGKWLIFDLNQDGHLVSHLGMSGSWQISNVSRNEKHGHIEMIDHQKEKNGFLTYVDPRRFGHFYILNEANFQKFLSRFPMDITDPEFDENKIAELFFRNSQKKLKPFLLDQSAFPGIGNYMASEICAKAGILPIRIVGEITDKEILKIKNAIDDVVTGAIETKGTTFGGGYRDANGEKGEGVKHLVVFYQNECQLCLIKNRHTRVIKINLAGRGTYFCPVCQS